MWSDHADDDSLGWKKKKNVLTLNGTACFACWASTRLKSIFRLGNDIILVNILEESFLLRE